ncbi:MAG: hypothetical protein M3Z31_01165 [Pseudomonadota bacterium]|nr:hypothetical protein [Pseudomonadota bacterium]
MHEQPNSPGRQSATNPSTTPDQGSSQSYGRSRSSGGLDTSSDVSGAGGSDVIGHAKDTISNVASQAGSKVTTQLDGQRDKAAEGLGTVAQALRQTSDQLKQQNDGPGAAVHQYVASAADQMDRLSGYLRSTNVNEMVGNVGQFARRQPALFIGSAFLLGLLGARFLKSSGQASSGSGYGGSIDRSHSLESYGAGQQYGTSGYGGSGGSQRYGTTGSQQYGNPGSQESGSAGTQRYGNAGTQQYGDAARGSQGGSGSLGGSTMGGTTGSQTQGGSSSTSDTGSFSQSPSRSSSSQNRGDI